ncbi:MAG: DEAD/DEAH box helicase [Rhodothermaceae bacterium]|nr:DEAD/DEAH box helicase [Rhodothermaceae bacterium]MXZ57665.1 DEAD/DEAH box helicase [Rhodothermaceae bacterium]MYB91325.1 DEAD/DEAH box helicase [Rhodothermaceae bacterium]MYD68766.1 DEAD/DEAH box helicase [Rhodothermaceae bacterium]MYG45420.1 DEAD/DEAH box helicase [Rhodothermaceae bacterium]
MPRDIAPLLLRDRLRKTLVRYIATAVPVSTTRAPELARAVREALEDSSLELTKGPFLESLPDFRKKGSIQELMDSGILTDHWHALQKPDSEWLLTRSLHEHQEQAIRQSTTNRNFIVATGTGSGKTECFLLPIVDRLLREEKLTEPGVRAVIIYPLNALANDQLYFRLAPLLLRQLGDPGITFGRFTGQVRSSANRREEELRLLDNVALRHALGLDTSVSSLPKSWLLSRSEMLETPPHILITNYAMLEHLLLLPRNAPLFHNARLQFIVLDEIHTYAGAQAIEVAFLLRKLKVYLGLEAGTIQAIGTSASLNVDDLQELAKFASDLFGEEFDAKCDLITGERKIHPNLLSDIPEIQLGPEKWIEVGNVVSEMLSDNAQSIEEWNENCECCDGIEELLHLDGHDLKGALNTRLAEISEVRSVAHELTDGLRDFESLANTTFPNSSSKTRNRALRSLISAVVFARPDNSEFPILPARYHLAVTGIDGGVVRLDSESKEGWSDFRPKKSHSDKSGVPYFGVLPCRNCGEPYLEGWYVRGRIFGKPVPGAKRAIFRIAALGDITAFEMGVGEEETVDEDEERLYVNPQTGIAESTFTPDGVQIIMHRLREDEDEKRLYLHACVVCGNRERRFPEPITTLHPGDDALAAVATQVLFEALPNQEDSETPKPLGGRKLLAFSDNRQDAAFFAPFFQRTSLNVTLRTCIVQAVREANDGGGLPLRQVRNKVWWLLNDGGQIAYKVYHQLINTSDKDAKDILFAQIIAEFFVLGQIRTSLEGLGIALVEYDQSSLDRLAEAIRSTAGNLSHVEARVFAELTLDRIRHERLIADPNDELDLSDEAIWGPFKKQKNRCINLQRNSSKQDRHIFGLLPRGAADNRSTWILEYRLNLSRDQAFQVLEKFWQCAREESLLIRANHRGYGLNLEKLRIINGIDLRFYECDKCGTRTYRSVRKICPSWRCDGRLNELCPEIRSDLIKENHYAHMYLREANRIGWGQNAIAREHSAAIGGQLRETIEEDFRTGKVNLLSCTTTLELGVDLGDLEATICKNMPPGITNYQQRTGRAGRRAQAAPVALTIARNTNYDQACFGRFNGYLSDRPAVPYIALENANFFRRHQISIVLAHFFRNKVIKEGMGAPQLKDLLGDFLSQEDVEDFMDTFLKWLESDEGTQAQELACDLISTLPAKFRHIGLQHEKLSEHLRKELKRFVYDIASRWQLLQERRLEAREINRDDIASIMQRQQDNLLNQFLVNALSRSAIIPTYSFPVHSCRLEIVKGRYQRPTRFGNLDADLQLDRTAALAISEYAPEAEIVAGGKIWTSSGIVRYPKAFMPILVYRICKRCLHVEIKDDRKALDDSCSQCDTPYKNSFSEIRKFIEPRGFLTSYSERHGKDPGATRLRPRSADEARLITRASPQRYVETDLVGVRTFFAPAFPMDGNKDLRGRMFIVNRGTHGGGFLRCNKCEFSMPAPQDARFGKIVSEKHNNPRTGYPCPVEDLQSPVDLGHIFETDVRAFCFDMPIPLTDDDSGESNEKDFLRTLAEALRRAAVRKLQIDTRDLVATFQWDQGNPVVILYDSVPGGAGYAQRLGNGTFAITKLVQEALGVLECWAECASSCVRCLNDYSNQTHWDKFDRHLVLPWMQDLF